MNTAAMTFLKPLDPLQPRPLRLTPDPGQRVLQRADYLAWCDAREAIDAARQQADAILADAKAVYQQEKQRGYEEGEQEARLRQAERIMETVGVTVDYLARFEHEIVDLVMGAVRKVIDGFDDEEKIMAVTRNALAIVRNQKQITLRLNPDQVDGVRHRVDELLAAFPVVGYIDIVPDTRVATGACILESEVGMIEASLEGQIEALRAAFQRILGSRV